MADGMAITWIGHATVLLELDGARVLTDPVLGGWAGPLRRIAASPAPEASAIDADVVLVSHLHADHADLPSLRRLEHARPRMAVAHGAGEWLRERGIPDVAELRAGEELQAGPLRVQATFAAHHGRRHSRTSLWCIRSRWFAAQRHPRGRLRHRRALRAPLPPRAR